MPNFRPLSETKFINDANLVKPCLFCGIDFTKKSKLSKKEWEARKYCSKACADKSRIGKGGYWTGKKLKPEAIAKMKQSKIGSIAWNKGKKWSQEVKDKFSKARIGTKRPHKGTKWTDESKLKMSNTNKGHYVSEETKEKIRQHRINKPTRVFKDTKIEIKIENELIKRGINYQKQVPLCKIAVVDFYLPEYRIVIQADGCYWHNCPEHGRGEIKNCSEKAIKQDNVLTFNGFNVYRFWEHEINQSVEDCINTIIL